MRTLRFRPDGTFKILQFTDMHLSHASEEDSRSTGLLLDITEREKPDLLVLTGDIFTDNNNIHEDVMEKACAAFDSAGVPWAFVMGNHEGDYENGPRAYKGEFVLAHSKNVIYEAGPAEIFGVGNYTVGIAGQDGRPKQILYMIDSNNTNQHTVNGAQKRCDDHIRRDQIDWYVKTSEAMEKKHGKLPALAFFHIPLPEYNDAWMFERCTGDRHEKVCCAPVNSGFFAAALARGDIRGMFAGHDHTNSYIADVMGIRLAYGRCSSYHCKLQLGFPRGAREITLYEDGRDFDTCIVLHDGTRLENEPASEPEFNRFGLFFGDFPPVACAEDTSVIE